MFCLADSFTISTVGPAAYQENPLAVLRQYVLIQALKADLAEMDIAGAGEQFRCDCG